MPPHPGDANGSFVGIALTLFRVEGRFQVGGTIPDGPADRGGLEVGDWIVEVDGVTIDGMELRDVVDIIVGPEGTQVNLLIDRPGESAPIEFKLKRTRIFIREATPAPRRRPVS